MSKIEFWPASNGTHVVIITPDRRIKLVAVWPKQVKQLEN